MAIISAGIEFALITDDGIVDSASGFVDSDIVCSCSVGPDGDR
jgi:hypothetical protein